MCRKNTAQTCAVDTIAGNWTVGSRSWLQYGNRLISVKCCHSLHIPSRRTMNINFLRSVVNLIMGTVPAPEKSLAITLKIVNNAQVILMYLYLTFYVVYITISITWEPYPSIMNFTLVMNLEFRSFMSADLHLNHSYHLLSNYCNYFDVFPIPF